MIDALLALFRLSQLLVEDDHYGRRWYEFTGKMSGAVDRVIERVRWQHPALKCFRGSALADTFAEDAFSAHCPPIALLGGQCTPYKNFRPLWRGAHA